MNCIIVNFDEFYTNLNFVETPTNNLQVHRILKQIIVDELPNYVIYTNEGLIK